MADRVKALLQRPEMNDEHILEVVNPTYRDRKRDFDPDRTVRPPLHEGRMSPYVGAKLEGVDHVIRANCFKIEAKFPECIYHYSLSIYQYKKDGSLNDNDLAIEEKDMTLGTTLLDKLKTDMRWEDAGGLTYDGRSAVFSTMHLVSSKENGGGEGDEGMSVISTEEDGGDEGLSVFASDLKEGGKLGKDGRPKPVQEWVVESNKNRYRLRLTQTTDTTDMDAGNSV